MAIEFKTKSEQIIDLARKLPCFTVENFVGVATNKNSLKVLFYRYAKKGEFVRLKKDYYTSKAYLYYINKTNQLDNYSEFISMVLCEPSYLSLDYMLYEYNMLTEMPNNFTSVTKKTTAHFSNQFGNFFYHTIKPNLFCGFEIIKKGDFAIYKATKAKALFDFLYLRKYSIPNKKAAAELRLNLNNFTRADKKEFDGYVKIEGSEKMITIVGYLFF